MRRLRYLMISYLLQFNKHESVLVQAMVPGVASTRKPILIELKDVASYGLGPETSDYLRHSSVDGGFPVLSYASSEAIQAPPAMPIKRRNIKRAFTIPKTWTGGDEVVEYHNIPLRRKVRFVEAVKRQPIFERDVTVIGAKCVETMSCADFFGQEGEQFYLINGKLRSLSELYHEFVFLHENNLDFPAPYLVPNKLWKVLTPFEVRFEWGPLDKDLAKTWFNWHSRKELSPDMERSQYPYELYVSSVRFDQIEMDVRVVGGSATPITALMTGSHPVEVATSDPRHWSHPFWTSDPVTFDADIVVFNPHPDWRAPRVSYSPANLKWLYGLKHRKLAIKLTTEDITKLKPVEQALIYCYAKTFPERFWSLVSQSPYAGKYVSGIFKHICGPFSVHDFEDIVSRTFNAHKKAYTLNVCSLAVMLISAGLKFEHADPALESSDDEKPMVHCPAEKPVHASRLRLRSQLNGANGEVTGLDDMARGKGKGPARPKMHGPKAQKQHNKAEQKKNRRVQKKIKKHMRPQAEGRVTKSDKVYSQVIAGMDTRKVKASGKLIDIQLNGKSGQVLFDSRMSVPVLCAAQGENGNLTNEMRNYTQSNIKSLKLLVHLNRLMGADEEIVVMTLNNENHAQDLSALYELRQGEPSVVVLKPSNFQMGKKRGKGVNQYMSTVDLNIVHSTRYIWGSHNKDIARLVIFVYQRANVVPLASAPAASTTAVADAEGLAAPAGKIMFLAEVELIEKSLPNQSSEYFEEPERGPLENQISEPTSSAPYSTNNQVSTMARVLMAPEELKAAINAEASLGIEYSGTPVTPSVDIDGGDVTHETFGTIMTVMSAVEVVLTAVGAPELAAIVVGAELVVGVVDKLFGTPESANAKAIEIQQANNLSSNGTPQDVTGPRPFFSPAQDTQRPGTVVSKPSQSPYFSAWLSASNGLNGTLTTVGQALYDWGFYPLLWNSVNTGTSNSYLQDTEMLYDVFVRDTPAGVETLAASPLHLADGSTITSPGPYLGQPVLRRRGPQLSNTVPYLPISSVPQLGSAYSGRKYVIFAYDTVGDPNAVMVVPVVPDTPGIDVWKSLFPIGSTPTLAQVAKFFGCSYSTTPATASYSLHCEFTYRRVNTLLELQENIITNNGVLTGTVSDHTTSSGQRKNWSGLAATTLFFDLTAGVDFSALKAVPYFDKRFVQEKCLRITPTLSPRLWNEADALYTAIYEIRTDF